MHLNTSFLEKWFFPTPYTYIGTKKRKTTHRKPKIFLLFSLIKKAAILAAIKEKAPSVLA
jgi:hypothetical protein